jgi:hypothetical protein
MRHLSPSPPPKKKFSILSCYSPGCDHVLHVHYVHTKWTRALTCIDRTRTLERYMANDMDPQGYGHGQGYVHGDGHSHEHGYEHKNRHRHGQDMEKGFIWQDNWSTNNCLSQGRPASSLGCSQKPRSTEGISSAQVAKAARAYSASLS